MSTSDAQEEKAKPEVTVTLPSLPENNTSQPPLTNPLSLSPPADTPQMLTDQKSVNIFNRQDRFGTYINYGFGVPFSYWKDYDVYPFVEPKYKSLKEEFLDNTIYQIQLDRYNEILEKGQELHSKIGSILGQNDDKNTPVAREKTHWNDYCNIKPGTLISLEHLLSIIFYTDLTALTTKMKVGCRKIKSNETVEHVKKRQVEFVHWLKLMTETLIFYGNKLSTKDDPIYHGLSGKFMFNQFKAHFHIPTSTTTDRGTAVNFAKDNGIVLAFGGLESVGDPYFDTASISAYPDEKEYLFFRAELNITDVYMRAVKFSMKPLSLYQSIINGSIIIDKLLDDSKNSKKNYQKTQSKLFKLLEQIEQRKNEENKSDEDEDLTVDEYGIQLLENFIEKNRIIYINYRQILDKISMGKLRAKFIKEDKKQFEGYSDELLNLQKFKVIELYAAETYTWTINQDEFDELKADKVLATSVIRFGENESLVKFYCQINCQEKENENDEMKENESQEANGRMSLILHKFGKKNPEKKTITISCDFFCKQMSKYYIRFHSQKLILKGNEENTRVTAVFEWEKFIKAFEKKNKIDWIISIRKVAMNGDDEKTNDNK